MTTPTIAELQTASTEITTLVGKNKQGSQLPTIVKKQSEIIVDLIAKIEDINAKQAIITEVVDDRDALLALTFDEVQNGDFVKVLDDNGDGVVIYKVIDDQNLDDIASYEKDPIADLVARLEALEGQPTIPLTVVKSGSATVTTTELNLLFKVASANTNAVGTLPTLEQLEAASVAIGTQFVVANAEVSVEDVAIDYYDSANLEVAPGVRVVFTYAGARSDDNTKALYLL